MKVSPQKDLEILASLATKESQKSIAHRLGVSPSYVSKLKNGKKKPYIHVVPNQTIQDGDITAITQDIAEVMALIDTKDIITTPKVVVTYIESEIQRCIIRLKIYQEILRRIK